MLWDKVELFDGSIISVGDDIKNVKIEYMFESTCLRDLVFIISSSAIENLLILDCDKWLINGSLYDPYNV